MIILGFETTDTVASVAIYINGEISSMSLNRELRHAESVLPAAESLLTMKGLSVADVDAFAVDIGPGSFTGVRIGVCLANALAYANQKPVIPVNALETLAYAKDSDNKYVAAIIDAKNGNGYAALYKENHTVIEPYACVISEFMQKIPTDCILTGTACEKNVYPSAESIVMLASERTGYDQVSPLYLKPSQAERVLKV